MKDIAYLWLPSCPSTNLMILPSLGHWTDQHCLQLRLQPSSVSVIHWHWLWRMWRFATFYSILLLPIKGLHDFSPNYTPFLLHLEDKLFFMSDVYSETILVPNSCILTHNSVQNTLWTCPWDFPKSDTKYQISEMKSRKKWFITKNGWKNLCSFFSELRVCYISQDSRVVSWEYL